MFWGEQQPFSSLDEEGCNFLGAKVARILGMSEGTSRQPHPANSRLRLLIAALAFALVAWLHGPALGWLAAGFLRMQAAAAGCTLVVGEANGRLFAPVVFRDVVLGSPEGTDLRIAEASMTWAPPSAWSWSPASWIGGVAVRDIRGRVVRGVMESGREASTVSGLRFLLPTLRLPPRIALDGVDVDIEAGRWSMALRGVDLLLDESRTGTMHAAEVVLQAGRDYRQVFRELDAVTAWRGGTAYFSGCELGEGIVVDELSLALRAGTTAVTVEARVLDGYVYADWFGDGAGGLKLAVNAFNLPLTETAAFAGWNEGFAGRIDLAKLTFNGNPSQWVSGQVSLRLELTDALCRGRPIESLTAGVSLAGRRVRINEFVLKQPSNAVSARGTVTVPLDGQAWRDAPFEFDAAAEVGDLAVLAGLFGAPWDEVSGGVSVEGRGSGRLSDGDGWLKLRGWDLRARGMPAASMQADFRLAGRDLHLTALRAQSGVNFLRASGQASLGAGSYSGRLELQVREVARYLEPLGRFAPDWAREGGVLLFWEGDGTAAAHSGVASVELVKFTGDLNPVPVNAKLAATYAPGNLYVSRFLLDRGPLSLSSEFHFGKEGMALRRLQLFSGRTRLLSGEALLPVSLEALLGGGGMAGAIRADAAMSAVLRSDNLELGALAGLFGQEPVLQGKTDLVLEAGGTWKNPVLEGTVDVAGLRAEFPSLRLPSSRFKAQVHAADRHAAFEASLAPARTKALTAKGRVAIMGRHAGGGWTLIDAAAPWEVDVEIPSADAGLFSPKWRGATVAAGTVSASAHVTGTPDAPDYSGRVAWEKLRMTFEGGWTALEEFSGQMQSAEGDGIDIGATATMGGGTLQASGKLAEEIRVQGRDLGIFEDGPWTLRGNADFVADADRIGGEIQLQGSVLSADPVITPGPIEEEAVGAIPAPSIAPLAAFFPGSMLDVRLSAPEPLSVGAPGSTGVLVPWLKLSGTVERPVLSGTVAVERLGMRFPGGATLLADGRVHFSGAQPWVPLFDVTARGGDDPLHVDAGIYGAPGRGALVLTSTPSLTHGEILRRLAEDKEQAVEGDIPSAESFRVGFAP